MSVPVDQSRRCEGCERALVGPPSKKCCDARCRALASRRRQRERMQALVQRLKNDVAELEQLIGEDEPSIARRGRS